MSFKIWNDSDAGRKCHIEIDGEDVSRHFQHLRIEAGIETAVEIEMDPIVFEVPDQRFKNDWAATVRLRFGAKDTRELLIKHGWTPPAEDVAVVVQPAVELDG